MCFLAYKKFITTHNNSWHLTKSPQWESYLPILLKIKKVIHSLDLFLSFCRLMMSHVSTIIWITYDFVNQHDKI